MFSCTYISFIASYMPTNVNCHIMVISSVVEIMSHLEWNFVLSINCRIVVSVGLTDLGL